MDDLDALGKSSDTFLNGNANALAGLQLGAGLSGASSGDLENGLFRINRLIGEGNKKLSQFGIKKDTPTLEALQLIAEKIKNTKSATEQGAIAYSVLGKASKGLMPFLKSGSAGIQEFIDQNNELGGSGIDRVGIAGVEAFQDSLLKIKTVFKNIFSVLAIKVAPILTAITDSVLELGTSSFSVTEMINTGFNIAVMGVGIFLDVIHFTTLAWKAMKAIAVATFSFFVSGFNMAIQGAKIFLGLFGIKFDFLDSFSKSVENFDKAVKKSSKNVTQEFDKAFLAKTPSENLNAFFQNVKAKANQARADLKKVGDKVGETLNEGFFKAQESASKMLEKMQDKIKFFGQDSTTIEISKLKQLGIDTKQLSIAQQKLKLLEAEKKLTTDLATKAQSVIESLKTPLQKQKEELDSLRELFSKGLINQDQLDKASSKITSANAIKKNDFKLGAGARFGSQEAKNIIARSRNLGKQNGLDVAKKQLSLQEKMVASLKTIEKNKPVEIVEFAF